MQISILGGTGRIGGHLLGWALDAGHSVHALARRPESLPQRPGLTVTRGDAPPRGRTIARADVAHFIAAALTGNGWLHAAPALAY